MVLDPTKEAVRGRAPDRVRAVVLDFVERAGWSAGQVFFATLLAGGTAVSVANLPWKYASVMALGAVVASVILTAGQYVARLQDFSRTSWPRVAVFWADLGLRLFKTFVASLVGSVAAATPFNIMSFDWSVALNVAFLATLGALAKGLLARGSDAAATVKPAAEEVSAPNPSTLPASTYLAAVKG